MLSCAAIQKLERYAQLGLKRHSVEELIITSLKDPKRANVYALTHEETWREALRAICGSTDPLDERKDVNNGVSPSTFLSGGMVRISENFIFALSFSAAFVRHHIHGTLFELLPLQKGESGEEQRKVLQETLLSPEVLQKQKELQQFPPVFMKDAEDTKVSIEEAPLQLIRMWRDILVKLAQEAGSASSTKNADASPDASAPSTAACSSVHIAHGMVFTQAVSHLMKVVSDLLVMLLTAVTVFGEEARDSRTSNAMKMTTLMLDDVLVLVAAVTKLLRRAAAHAPLDKELQQKSTSGAGLQSYLKSCLGNSAKNGWHSNSSELLSSEGAKVRQDELYRFLLEKTQNNNTNNGSDKQPPPFLVLLMSYLLDSSTGGLLESFTLFQRLALLYATLSAAGIQFHANAISSMKPSLTSSPSLHSSLSETLTPKQRANYSEALLRSLCLLVNGVACNKSTRLVVYYRSDEMALLQNDVRDALSYSLHTFVTSPPIDPAVKDPCLSLMLEENSSKEKSRASNDGDQGNNNKLYSAAQRRRCGLHLLIWIVSAPFFYASFCTNESWKELAKEQRRLVLLQRAGKRKLQQQRQREKKRESSSSSASSRSSSRGSVRDDRQGAPLSSGASFNSNASADSRASRLSMLSAASAASYESFLSILPPEAEDLEGRERHESSDGNTNLPLILLEECVLGLYSFLQAYPPAMLDSYGLREAGWESIAKCFSLVQSTLTSAVERSRALVASPANAFFQNATAYLRVVAPTASVTPSLFDLGQDVQYNHGLGYECLALLFARIVAPRLEATHPVLLNETLSEEEAQGNAIGSGALVAAQQSEADARAWYRSDDPLSLQQHLEAAMAACLSTYETVAPQVVDRYLSAIVRMAAKATTNNAPEIDYQWSNKRDKRGEDKVVRVESVSDMAALPSAQLAIQFLCALIERLGKSNQLPMFFNAVFTLTTIEPFSREAAQAHGTSGDSNTAPLVGDDKCIATLALRKAFRHPVIRSTLISACSLTMDSEQLLQHFIGTLTTLSSNSEIETPKPSPHPSCVALFLDLLSLTLIGVPCTSVISRTILELATELDLLITVFLDQHVETITSECDQLGSFDAKYWQAVLWQGGLDALYHCRALTHECVQDLGEDNIQDYVAMLEETLWQVTENVQAVCGSTRSVEEISQILSPIPSSLSTPVLPFLVLQRLTLSRSVAVLLQRQAEIRDAQSSALKHMVKYILGELSRFQTAAASEKRSVAKAVVSLANQLSEEEWKCLSMWSGSTSKRLRTTLVSLLEATFYRTPVSSKKHASVSVWLQRCLRCVGGVLLRAATDVFLLHSFEEDFKQFQEKMGADDASKELQAVTPLSLAMDVLLWIYDITGHIPYWPTLLDHSLRSLRACLSAQKQISRSEKPSADGAPKRKKTKTVASVSGPVEWSLEAERHLAYIQEQLLMLMSRCVLSEPHSQETLGRLLGNLLLKKYSLNKGENSSLNAGDTIQWWLSSSAKGSDGSFPKKRDNASGVQQSYIESIGVPLATLSEMDLSITANEDEEDSEKKLLVQEWCFEEELLRVCDKLWIENSWMNELGPSLMSLHRNAHHSTGSEQQANHTPSLLMEFVYAMYIIALRTAELLEKKASTVAEAKFSPNFTASQAVSSAIELRQYANSVIRAIFFSGAENSGEASIDAEFLLPFIAAATSGSNFGGLFLSSGKQCKELVALQNSWKDIFYTIMIQVLKHISQNEEKKESKPASKRSREEGNDSKTRYSTLVDNCACLNYLYPILRRSFTSVKSTSSSPPKHHNDSALREVLFYPSQAEGKPQEMNALGTKLVEAMNDMWGNTDKSIAYLIRFAQETVASSFFYGHGSSDAGTKTKIDSANFFSLLRSGSVPTIAVWTIAKIGEILNSEEKHSSTYVAPSVLVSAVFSQYIPGEEAQVQKEDVMVRKIGEMIKATSSGVSRRVPLANYTSSSSKCVDAFVFRLQQLVAAQEALALIEAPAAPAALHVYLHQLLQHLLVLASSDNVALTLDDNDTRGETVDRSSNSFYLTSEMCRTIAYVVSTVMYRLLTRVQGMRAYTLQRSLVRLLQITNHLCMATSATSNGVSSGNGPLSNWLSRCGSISILRQTVLALLAIPAPRVSTSHGRSNNSHRPQQDRHGASEDDNVEEVLAEASWLFISTIVEQSLSSLHSLNGKYEPLSQGEVLNIFQLFSRRWLREEGPRQSSILWKRVERLPALMSSLFEVVLMNIASERFGMKVLHALGALFFHLTRQAEDVSRDTSSKGAEPPTKTRKTEAQPNRDSGKRDRSSVEEEGKQGSEDEAEASRPSTAARMQSHAQRVEQQRRLFAVASMTSAMFQISERYVSVFTTFSGDTDGLVMDLLRALQRCKLPKKLAPPISFQKGKTAPLPKAYAEEDEHSAATLCDLAYIAVGSEEGKALLRQAAQRLEEQGGISGGSGIGRQLFNVE